MRVITDHLGRKIRIPKRPLRIVSLCPCVTESLVEIGAANQLAGRTRFCIHPDEVVKNIPRIGGTKQVHYESIRRINPDLIIAVKEENTREIVETLEKEYPVFVFDIQTTEAGIYMIEELGILTGNEAQANKKMEATFQNWRIVKGTFSPISVLYVIWQNPFMAAGKDTYIHDIIQGLGWQNAAATLLSRYPEFRPEDFSASPPDKILLSSEPYPFQEKHIPQFQTLFPHSQIQIADGEMFSWHGTRLERGSSYFEYLR